MQFLPRGCERGRRTEVQQHEVAVRVERHAEHVVRI